MGASKTIPSPPSRTRRLTTPLTSWSPISWTLTLMLPLLVLLLLLPPTALASSGGGGTPNVLNADNTISWGDLAPDKAYQTAGYVADDGGLDPYYALAKSFIDSSLPGDLPIDKSRDIIDGKVEMIQGARELALEFVGFMICLVIGLLFIIIFPIVGLCFCCCRCCGNCGGKRIQKPDDNASCKRYVFSAILFILSMFVVTGAACTFVTSDQLSKNLDGLGDSFNNSVNDMEIFVDNIHSQFTRLGDTNFVFLRDVLTNFIGNVSDKISEGIITEINQLVDLDQPIESIQTHQADAKTDVEQLETLVTQAESQRDTAVTNLVPVNTAAPCSGCIQTEIDGLNALDFASMQTQLATFKSNVATDLFGEMKTDLETQIKAEVDQSTQGINVQSSLDDIYNNQIKTMLDQVDTLRDTVASDLEDYRQKVQDYTDTVEPYDQYRWYAGVGLASFLLLIAVLMVLGIVMGVLCGSAKTRPTERGCASNCGGILLMAAVGLIFIFGALLMLLTTLMYIFGSVTERYVCQGFDDLTKLEEYTDSFDSIGFDLKNISFDLNGNQISTGVSKLMDGCKDDQTLYTVLGLQSVVNDSLKEIDDYKNTINITENMDLGDTAAQAAGSVDISAAILTLKDTSSDLTNLETAISNMKGAVETTRDSIDTKTSSTSGTSELTPLITTLTQMETVAADLKTTTDQIVADATDVETKVGDLTTQLGDTAVMEPLIKGVTQGYVDTMFGFVDSYVNEITSKLATDVGKCTPVYSIFHAIFNESFCHGIIDPLNGFWLALGWCIFFFMPSLIFAVKLAKHFRQMKFDDNYANPTVTPSAPPPSYEMTHQNGKGSQPPTLFPPNGNKVAPF